MPEEHTKVDPNSPAFPLPTFDLTRNEIKYPAHVQGMSKREYFAAMAMQALIPHIHADSMLGAGIDNMATSSKASKIGTVAAMAIEAADALIEALNNTERSNAQATQ